MNEITHITRDIWWVHWDDADRETWTKKLYKAGFDLDSTRSFLIDSKGVVGAVVMVRDEEDNWKLSGHDVYEKYVGEQRGRDFLSMLGESVDEVEIW